jgi:hypothetical protein
MMTLCACWCLLLKLSAVEQGRAFWLLCDRMLWSEVLCALWYKQPEALLLK